ncbi:hypothetical protein ACFX1T_026949 [Malus domestica]
MRREEKEKDMRRGEKGEGRGKGEGTGASKRQMGIMLENLIEGLRKSGARSRGPGTWRRKWVLGEEVGKYEVGLGREE